MKKKTIFALTATIAFITFFQMEKTHAQIGRGPSVEPIVEVDIENGKKMTEDDKGFDFNHQVPRAATKRIPANIVSKNQSSAPTNYLGPFIFLLTLPIAIWIVISKKIKSQSTAPEKTVDYYPKTQQFNPYKTDYQQSAEDEDDIDFPKAS